MKLEEIGFYTLSEERAKNVSFSSDLQRCELILTDRCNFKCAYCRGIKKDLQGDMSLERAKHIVDLWTSNNLHNIRFSGGEPTIWEGLVKLVAYTKSKSSIEHIALSTNGSADLDYYKLLAQAGVNDFSISLDACCSMTADMMAGTNAKFDHITTVIKELSKITYVTVGVVLDERNTSEIKKIIDFATSLGVHDIRIIPSAQSDHRLSVDIKTDYPILKYRIQNMKKGIHVRGLSDTDGRVCHLVKDDMIILNNYHYPCVIYMREQGKHCGTVDDKTIEQIRKERKNWFAGTNVLNDPICKKNCLDVCRQHNNKISSYKREKALDRSFE